MGCCFLVAVYRKMGDDMRCVRLDDRLEATASSSSDFHSLMRPKPTCISDLEDTQWSFEHKLDSVKPGSNTRCSQDSLSRLRHGFTEVETCGDLRGRQHRTLGVQQQYEDKSCLLHATHIAIPWSGAADRIIRQHMLGIGAEC